VEAGAAVWSRPLNSTLTVDDALGGYHEEHTFRWWSYEVASPSYFRARGQRIVRGRDFQDGEVDAGVIVDRRSADILWKGADPIGRSIKFGDAKSDAPTYRVIGLMDGPSYNEVIKFDFAQSDVLESVVRLASLRD